MPNLTLKNYMNTETEIILSHIENYTTTGVIHDALIPYFDQHGKWIGAPGIRSCAKSSRHLDRIKSSYLSASRRTSRDRAGTILRTSFVWRGSKSVHLTHSGIQGSLIVEGNANIHAAGLRHVYGSLISSTDKRVYLPNLRTVGGHFEFMHTFGLHVPRLHHVGGRAKMLGLLPPSLATIGKSLGVYWCFEAESDRLQNVGGSLVLTNAVIIHFPELVAIGGSFLLTFKTHVIHALKLESIGGDFLSKSAHEIRTPALRSVGGNMDTTSAKRYYHPRIKVSGEWTTFPGDVEDWTHRDAARRAMKQKPFWL